MKKLWEKILDLSIYFSFDRTGFLRHQKQFEAENYSVNDGKNVLITGGSSGIGLACVETFAQKGLHVFFVCRDKIKGEQVREEVIRKTGNQDIFCLSLDLGNLKAVKDFALSWKEGPLAILVNNAGGMSFEKKITSQGYEHIFASHVIGHYILTRLLLERSLLQKESRVIFVSSGGMYFQKLDLEDLNWERKPYNRYTAYANAKRAQIIMANLLAEKYGEKGVLFSSMHPGWVRTEGVKLAMPVFTRWMDRRLRTPKEGSDTIIWLALSKEKFPNGKFWFDRREVSPHLFGWTKEKNEDKKKLMTLCERWMRET